MFGMQVGHNLGEGDARVSGISSIKAGVVVVVVVVVTRWSDF
jgi:hypothetical protein